MTEPTPHPAGADARSVRDAGMTLTEVLVTMAMLGLISTIVAGAITVVFRSEAGVTRTVAQSHDLQQAVNYFHLDIQSGPPDVASYRATSGTVGSNGTGCADAGSRNVLRLDDGDQRIAYELTVDGAVGTLDRVECAWNGSSYDQVTRINIADELDASGGQAVTVDVVAEAGANSAKVDRVVMDFAQAVSDGEVSAAPRAEQGLAAGSPLAACADDPMEAALGFGAFVERDVYLETGSLEGSLAVGGELGWIGLREIAQHDTNNTNGFSQLAVYANEVDWSYGGTSSDILRATNGNKGLLLGTGYHVTQQGGNPKRVYDDGTTTGQHFEFPKNAPTGSTSANPVDFTVQFDLLKQCSQLMGGLPYSCSTCAEDVIPLNENGDGPYPGTGKLTLEFDNSKTQVLNIPESKLGDIPEVRRDNGSSLNANRALIVNVYEEPGLEDGDIVFDFRSSDWQNVGDSKFVIYNFPNATGTVTIEQDVYGVVFAPFASVVTKGQVHAAVVAADWTHQGGTVQNDESKIFNGTIDWD